MEAMTHKDVIEAAFTYLTDLYGQSPKELSVRLEEVRPVNGDFEINLSLEIPGTGAMSQYYVKRDYKVVLVNGATGQAESIPISC